MRPTNRTALYVRELTLAGRRERGAPPLPERRDTKMRLRIATRQFSVAMIAVLGLAACQPTGNGVVDPTSKPPVASARALQLFQAVCVGSYPSFNDAVDRMAANGISTLGNDGIVYSNSENLSFKLVPDSNGNKTCSIVFATRESTETFVQAAASLGTLDTSDNATVRVRMNNGRGTAVVGPRPVVSDGLTYHNIRLLSDR